MGHEASGIVHKIGDAVTSVQLGDHVAIEPGVPCRRCQRCKDGFYNLCIAVKFAAAPPDAHGMLTKYYRTPEDFVYKVPTGADSLKEAVLVEPLSVAIHAVRLAKIRPRQVVLIIGSGTIGLLCAAVARVFGAHRVIVSDIVERRLDFAKGYLDCDTFLSNIRDTAEKNSERLKRECGISQGVDAVIEASGADRSIQTAVHALRPGGSYVQTGIGEPMVEVPMVMLSEKELRVRGCFRYGPGDYELAIKLVSQGTISLGPLISSVSPFESTTAAWEKTRQKDGIKNIIEVFKTEEVEE